MVAKRRVTPTVDGFAALEAAALAGAADGTRLDVVIEPTGPAWLPVAVWFTTRGDTVFRVSTQKASDLRKFLPRLRRQLLAAGRSQSAAFWERTERTLSAIADGTATYGMVRTWLEATGTEPTQMVGGFVWPDESDRGPVATEMHARLVAHLEGLVAAGDVDPDRLLAGDAAALAAHEQAQADWLHTELEDGREPIWAVSDQEDEWLLAAWADADADAQQILTELLGVAAGELGVELVAVHPVCRHALEDGSDQHPTPDRCSRTRCSSTVTRDHVVASKQGCGHARCRPVVGRS